MRSSLAAVIVAVFALGYMTTDASAQMNNKPYSFSGGGSSLGMSSAARQAILNQKLTGATPDNLVRGPNGALLEVTRGPGNTAITRDQAGVAIPGYRGRGNIASGGVGLFNNFFYSGSFRRGGTYTFASRITGDAIAGWTGMVSGGRVYSGGNSVDAWTSQVGG